MKENNLLGRKIDTLTVIERGPSTPYGHRKWKVKCSECKNEFLVTGANITCGNTKGCKYCAKKKRFKFTDKQLDDLIELRKQGISYHKIAEMYNTSPSVIHRNVKRVTPRPKKV